MLALTVMNALLLILFAYTLWTIASNAQDRETAWLKDQHDVRELLARCVIPGGTFKLQSDEQQSEHPKDPEPK